MFRKVLYSSVAGFAVIALGAGAANASVSMRHANAPAVDVAAHTSQTLAGHAGEGNGAQSFNDTRINIVAPQEPICPPGAIVGSYPTATCADTVTLGSGVVPGELAMGTLLAQNTSVGGWENAIALVFDDPRPGACPADQWTVESGFGFYNFTGPVLPVQDLHPDAYFGNPICVNPGQSAYLELFETAHGHVIDYLEGPSNTNDNIVAQTFPPFVLYFHTFGFGVNTTNGNVAANLATGTLEDLTSAALTQVRNGFHRPGLRGPLGNWNYDDFIGTMTGGAPSVANPVTLTPGVVGPTGGFLVTVP